MAFNILQPDNQGISPPAPNTFRNQCSYLRSQDISTNSQTIDSYLNVNSVYANQLQADYVAINQNISLSAQLEDELETLFTQNCVKGIVAGDNITVDNTNPNYPIVSSTGGGGGGSFEGFNVHLPLDLAFPINSAGEKLTGWVADFSPQFYTSPNLSAGIYTAPSDGHYLIKFGGAGSPYVAVTVNDVPIQSNFEEIQGLIENVLYLSEGDQVSIVVATNLAVTFFKLNDGVDLSPFPISTYWSITLLNSGSSSSTPEFEGISVYIPNEYSYISGDNIAPWAADLSGFYTNDNFNLTTGEYTVPKAGNYLINAKLECQGQNLEVYVNGTLLISGKSGDAGGILNNINHYNKDDIITFQLPDDATIYAYSGLARWGSVMSITRINSSPDISSFKGISVVLDSDITYTFPNLIGNWATPESIYYSDSSFDLSTGIFTVPESGNYQFTLNVAINMGYPNMQVLINGTPKQEYITSGGGNDSNTFTGTFYLNQNDTLSFRFTDDTTVYKLISLEYGTWLNINKLNSNIITSISGQTIVETNILYSEVIGSNIKTIFNPSSDTYICNSIFAVRDLSTDYSGGDGSLAIYFTPIGSTPYDARVTVGIADSISTFSYNLITISGEAKVVSGPITAQVYGSGTDFTAGNCYIKMVLQKIG